MFIGSNENKLVTSGQSNLQIDAINQVVKSSNVFYPKEKGIYKLNRITQDGSELILNAVNKDALFYKIILGIEQGKKYVSIHSNFIEEIKQFLHLNDFPIKGWGADCDFHSNPYLSPPEASYYTTDPDVGVKLAKILIEFNQFEISENEKNYMRKFF